MFLVLARFIFGFGITLAAAVIVLVASAACVAIIRNTIKILADERGQDISNGIAVFLTVMLILLGVVAVGHFLYDLLGHGALSSGTPHWLAGDSRISAAALLGATSALGLMASVPAWLQHRSVLNHESRPSPATGGTRVAEEEARPTRRLRTNPGRAGLHGWVEWGYCWLASVPR